MSEEIYFGPKARCHKCKAQAAVFHGNAYWCGECYLTVIGKNENKAFVPKAEAPMIDSIEPSDISHKGNGVAPIAYKA